VKPFFDYTPQTRKVIYTTNAIESINMSSRKVINDAKLISNRRRRNQAVFHGAEQYQQVVVDADQRLEGGPKPLRHPFRRPDGAGVHENPLTQKSGHPRPSQFRTSPPASRATISEPRMIAP